MYSIIPLLEQTDLTLLIRIFSQYLFNLSIFMLKVRANESLYSIFLNNIMFLKTILSDKQVTFKADSNGFVLWLALMPNIHLI